MDKDYVQNSNYATSASVIAPTARLHCDVRRVLEDARSQPFYGTLSRIAYAHFRDGRVVRTGADLLGELERSIENGLRISMQDDARAGAAKMVWGSASTCRDSTDLAHALAAYEFLSAKPYDAVATRKALKCDGVTSGAALAFLPV